MDELLKFITDYCNFLYTDYNFKIVDSRTSMSFGGDSLVILESDKLKIQISRDRNQINFDFQSIHNPKKHNWYDFDVVKNYIKNPDFYQLDDEYSDINNTYDSDFQFKKAVERAKFIKENIKNIINIFSMANFTEASAKMNKLRNQRAKILFG